MSPLAILAVLVVLGFAFMLGVSDAPNASAALLAARATSYRGAISFAFIFHVLGGVLAGQAVAATMVTLVRVPPSAVPGTYLAGGIATIGFTWLATRRGIPVSASIGLVGGLAGAAAVVGGWTAVGWGGLHGWRPYGVIGTLAAVLVSPLLGVVVAGALRRALEPVAQRATRSSLRPMRGLIWLTAGLVAVADGSNDGQKAMGLVTGLLVASGALSRFSVPLWVTAVVAVVLATGTALGGAADHPDRVLTLLRWWPPRRSGGPGRLRARDPGGQLCGGPGQHLDHSRLRNGRGRRRPPPPSCALAYSVQGGGCVAGDGARLRPDRRFPGSARPSGRCHPPVSRGPR